MLEALGRYDAEGDIVRAVDFNIKPGVSSDEGEGDDWPELRKRVIAADILLLGSPIWLGQPSSVSKRVLERMDAFLGEKDERGRMPSYGKVAVAVVTGNEDGAKHAASSILYGLSHIGFTIPPNVDAYWVGEAGPGDSYMDAGRDNEFTKSAIERLAYNTYHFAGLLKNNPIPAEGNTL